MALRPDDAVERLPVHAVAVRHRTRHDCLPLVAETLCERRRARVSRVLLFLSEPAGPCAVDYTGRDVELFYRAYCMAVVDLAKNPGRRNLLYASLALGMMLLSKHTALLLPFFLPPTLRIAPQFAG